MTTYYNALIKKLIKKGLSKEKAEDEAKKIIAAEKQKEIDRSMQDLEDGKTMIF